jgi:hypothetical protein
MCRSLICLVAVLSLTGAVQAVTVIDDFEGYFDDAGLRANWIDNTPPASTSYLMTSGGSGTDGGVQAMKTDYAVPGGWASDTGTAVNDHSGVVRHFDPIDWQTGNTLMFDVKIEPGVDLSKANYYLLEYSGDKYGQTWMPCQGQLNPWWEPYPELPAVLVNDDWVNPGNLAGITSNTKIIRPSSGWVTVTINDTMGVPWGAALPTMDAITGLDFQLWAAARDNTGASGGYRLDSTGGTVWPVGPLSGTIDLDNVRFIPEPATIAMLGLGGLALIRRKK